MHAHRGLFSRIRSEDSRRVLNRPTVLAAAAMAQHGFTLYLALYKEDYAFCQGMGNVPRRYAGGRSYSGLRELEVDAMERAQILCSEQVHKGTHGLLRVKFTAQGLAHYCTSCCGVEVGYAPLLSKKVCWQDPMDWKVWHFLGDLETDWLENQ